MKNPRDIILPYGDLLDIISSLKTEAHSYKVVGMKSESNKLMKLRKTFLKIKNAKRYSTTIISY